MIAYNSTRLYCHELNSVNRPVTLHRSSDEKNEIFVICFTNCSILRWLEEASVLYIITIFMLFIFTRGITDEKDISDTINIRTYYDTNFCASTCEMVHKRGAT